MGTISTKPFRDRLCTLRGGMQDTPGVELDTLCTRSSVLWDGGRVCEGWNCGVWRACRPSARPPSEYEFAQPRAGRKVRTPLSLYEASVYSDRHPFVLSTHQYRRKVAANYIPEPDTLPLPIQRRLAWPLCGAPQPTHSSRRRASAAARSGDASASSTGSSLPGLP